MVEDTSLYGCPECGASNTAYVNVGNVRQKGENNTQCAGCKATIVIAIDIHGR